MFIVAVLNESFAGIVEGTENSFFPCEDNDDYNLISFEYGKTNPTPFTFTLNSITRVEVTETEFNQDTDAGQAKMGEIRENSGEDCTKAFIFTGESDTRGGSSNFPQVRSFQLKYLLQRVCDLIQYSLTLWKQWCQTDIDEDHTFLHYEKLAILDGDDNDYGYDYQIKTIVHELGKKW